MDDVALVANVRITNIDNGDGTRTVEATLTLMPFFVTNEDGSWGWGYNASYGFLDQYTGRLLLLSDADSGEVLETTVEFDGESYAISGVKESVQQASYTDADGDGTKELSPAIRVLAVTCPADYDGAAFFLSGWPNGDEQPELVMPYEDYENGGFERFFFDAR